jgi:YRPW motif-containing protein
LAYDPHKFAMDYHNIGFRECTAEVARYLVSVEGMDVQDPLRLRLMSHLQCFAAQRELSNKPVTAAPGGGGSVGSSGVVTSPVSSAAAPSSAIINTPAPSNAWPFPPTPGSYGGGHNVNSAVQHHNFNNHPATSSSGGQQSGTPGPSSVFDQSAHHYGMDMGNSFGHPAAANAARLHHHTAMPHHHHHQTGTTMTTLQPVQPGHPHHPATASYPHVNHHPFPTLAAQNGGYTTSGNQVRPYRPWGAELVY